MQLHIGHVLLMLAVFFTSSVRGSEPPTSGHKTHAAVDRTEWATRAAASTAAIYSIGSFIFGLSACQLITNHVEIPYLSPSSISPYIPPTGCVALGLAVGAVTGASHARYTHNDTFWKWVEERVGWVSPEL